MSQEMTRTCLRCSAFPPQKLTSEALPVDGLPAGAGAVGEVTALEHELRDDAVEDGSLVVERLAALANTLLAGAAGRTGEATRRE